MDNKIDNNELDDLTYNLLCNKQKKSKKNSFIIKSKETTLPDIPEYNINDKILKIIKKKLNNINHTQTELDDITNSLLNSCINLIKYNLSLKNKTKI